MMCIIQVRRQSILSFSQSSSRRRQINFEGRGWPSMPPPGDMLSIILFCSMWHKILLKSKNAELEQTIFEDSKSLMLYEVWTFNWILQFLIASFKTGFDKRKVTVRLSQTNLIIYLILFLNSDQQNCIYVKVCSFLLS